MKKLYSIAMIAACAMMVFSCKNNGKSGEEIPDAVEEGIEAVEEAAGQAADAIEKAVDEAGNAIENAVDRTDEALERLGDIRPYTSVETKPTFQGGDADAFLKYIQKNIEYPQSAIDNEEQGRVLVNFVVDASGKIRNAKVVKGVSAALDAEALRVVNNAPDWEPAKEAGKTVPVTYSVPVVFTLR